MFFTPERIALLLCLVGGYIFGLVQTGFFISKAKHVDIKHLGSGNTGATNTWRVMGAPWGLLTLLLDFAKTIVAIIIAYHVLINGLKFDIPYFTIVLYTGLGVVLGHDFPVYLKFKGGKGIACSFAIFLCFKQWQYIIVGILVFFIVLLFSKFVSLSSILTMIFELAVFLLCMLLNISYVSEEFKPDSTIIIILLVLLAIFTHRSNIVRLFFGEEPKFRFKKYDLDELNTSEEDDFDEDEEIEDFEEAEEDEEEILDEEVEETEEVEEEIPDEEVEETEEVEELPEEEVEEIEEEIEEVEETKEANVTKEEDSNSPRVIKVVLSNWKNE